MRRSLVRPGFESFAMLGILAIVERRAAAEAGKT